MIEKTVSTAKQAILQLPRASLRSLDSARVAAGQAKVRPAMDEPDANGVSCYSAHLVRPFALLLEAHPQFPAGAVAELLAMDPDERIPCEVAHQMQSFAVQISGDPDLGLRATQKIEHGDVGALDYLLTSGATVEDAVLLMGRYMRLATDVLDVKLEVVGDEARVHLENRLPLTRQSMDFQVGSLYKNHARAWMRGAVAELRVCFTHSQPASIAEYGRVFSPAKVVFSSPFMGFVFDKSFLRAPLQLADSKLHQVLKQHVQQIMTDLPKAQTWTDRVRALATQELAGGNPTAAHIAHKLGLSSRTLGRKLEREGTTFSDLFDDLRRRLALQYVGGRDLNLSEVALLLGFSQTAAFHRAFRRWTDRTPLQYRRAAKK
jgi:AraC-like DNA-binding protein